MVAKYAYTYDVDPSGVTNLPLHMSSSQAAYVRPEPGRLGPYIALPSLETPIVKIVLSTLSSRYA